MRSIIADEKTKSIERTKKAEEEQKKKSEEDRRRDDEMFGSGSVKRKGRESIENPWAKDSWKGRKKNAVGEGEKKDWLAVRFLFNLFAQDC
jgi:hypothetical protein